MPHIHKGRLLITFLLMLLIPLIAHAQFYEPTGGEWEAILQQVRGYRGLSLFGGAVLVAQGLFMLMRTAFGEMLGFNRLLILSLLSIIVTLGTKVIAGEPILSAIFDAPSLVCYQIAASQFLIQWRKRASDREEIDSPGTSS